jgi:hypothetical protein
MVPKLAKKQSNQNPNRAGDGYDQSDCGIVVTPHTRVVALEVT